MSERAPWRSRLLVALMRSHLLLAASHVPEWRTDVTHRPAAVLIVGEPVTRLHERRANRDEGPT